MNTNASKPYEDAIQELFINATCSYGGTAEEELSNTLEKKTKEKVDVLMDFVPEADRMAVDNLMTDIIFEYREAFYIEGFRRAIKLIFDGLMEKYTG